MPGELGGRWLVADRPLPEFEFTGDLSDEAIEALAALLLAAVDQQEQPEDEEPRS